MLVYQVGELRRIAGLELDRRAPTSSRGITDGITAELSGLDHSPERASSMGEVLRRQKNGQCKAADCCSIF